MKILVFSPYYPPHIGGLEFHANEFNRHFARRGHQITVFTPRFPADSPEKEECFKDVMIVRFPAFEIVPGYPVPKLWSLRFWRIFFKLFQEKYDFTISRTRFFLTSLLALLYAKIKRVRWVHIEHGSDFVQLDSSFKNACARVFDHTFGRLILALSDQNIANSKASARFCQKLSRQKPCEIVYRGVEMERIKQIQPDTELKNRFASKPIIAFVGRLIDTKGIKHLFEALGFLPPDAFSCFIVGDGPQRKELENLGNSLGIKHAIRFWGHKPPDETIAIIKVSDIVVNPSHTEGLPTSIIEAALCKKAIVATNVGGTPEIFSNPKSGFLVPPRNPQAIAEKLKILIADEKLRHSMGENAYEEVKEKFLWENSIAKYLKIFSQLQSK